MAISRRPLRNRMKDMSISSRLVLGFLVILAFMAVVGLFGIYQMNRLAALSTLMYRHPLTVSNAVRDVHINIVRMHRSMKDVVLAADAQSLNTAIQAIDQDEQQVYATVDIIQERFLGDQKDVDDVIQTFRQWKPLRDNVIALMQAGQRDEATTMTQGAGQEHLQRLEKELQDLTDFAGNKALQFLNNAESTAYQAYGLTLGLLVAAVGVGLVIAARMSRRITRPLQQAVQVARQVSEGDLTVQFGVASQDEYGQMFAAMQQMIAYIQEAAAVAEKISNQQLDVAVVPKSPQDILNHSLQRMIVNIRAMLDDINRSLKETEQQNWLKDGLNQLNTSVLGDQSLHDICRTAVSFVARYVDAGHAVLYTYNTNEHVLHLGGAFAMTEQDRLADTYRLGEGIIGQVARDRSPIFLDNLRRADQVITTGTVSEAPLNTYTLPLVYNDELYGVVEVAAFEPLDTAKQRFLDAANPALATILFSALQRERVQTLLEQSQRAAQEAEIAVHDAQNAKEEAQQQSEELQRANAQLEEQQQRLQQQSEELRQINVHLEEQQHEIQEQRDSVHEREKRLQQAQAELERRTRELDVAGEEKMKDLMTHVALLHDPLHSMLDTLKYVFVTEEAEGDDTAAKQLRHARQAGEHVLAMVHNITEGLPIDASVGSDSIDSVEASLENEIPVAQQIVPPTSDSVDVGENCDTDSNTATDQIDDDRQSIRPGDTSILIIEDNVDIAQSLVDIIREMGFRAIMALNGYDGLALAARFRPIGIMLDLMLPDLNGVEVLRELKRTRELRRIPVHIMSSKDRDDTLMKAGAIGFTQKPISEDDVREVVNRLFQESQDSVHAVLIVEDNDAQREAIQQLLGEQASVETVGVASRAAAIAEIDSGRYDAAILDLGLKDGSGYDICRYVKERAIDLPLIIYTGKDLDEDEERELRQYTDSIIIKTAHSSERLQDEVAGFLQQVISTDITAAAISATPRSVTNINLSGKKILVVDDDVKNVFVLASVLEEQGATVLDARNGREALEKLRTESGIGLVLMDVMMPLMGGHETMQAIRKDPRLKDLPIIAITAKTLLEDRLQCIESGADDYLTKPVDYDSLLRLVNAWIEKD